MGPGNTDGIENGESIASQQVEGVGAGRCARPTMPAGVVADDPKDLTASGELRLPQIEIGPE
jgi:hypothetical protein